MVGSCSTKQARKNQLIGTKERDGLPQQTDDSRVGGKRAGKRYFALPCSFLR
jgi:hypothetical protein